MKDASFVALMLLSTACASASPKETRSPTGPATSEVPTSEVPTSARDAGSTVDAQRAPEIDVRGRKTPEIDIDYRTLPDLPEYPCEQPHVIRDAGTVDAGDNGKLAQVDVHRVIRTNYPKLRQCYRDGLRRNPSLGGRVTVRFVIEKDGRVGQATPICTNMPDRAVVACIVAEFKNLQFPSPDRGVVTVVFPTLWLPADE